MVCKLNIQPVKTEERFKKCVYIAEYAVSSNRMCAPMPPELLAAIVTFDGDLNFTIYGTSQGTFILRIVNFTVIPSCKDYLNSVVMLEAESNKGVRSMATLEIVKENHVNLLEKITRPAQPQCSLCSNTAQERCGRSRRYAGGRNETVA